MRTRPAREQIAVHLDPAQLDEVERLRLELEAQWPTGRRVTRAAVVRLVVARGLERVAAELREARLGVGEERER